MKLEKQEDKEEILRLRSEIEMKERTIEMEYKVREESLKKKEESLVEKLAETKIDNKEKESEAGHLKNEVSRLLQQLDDLTKEKKELVWELTHVKGKQGRQIETLEREIEIKSSQLESSEKAKVSMDQKCREELQLARAERLDYVRQIRELETRLQFAGDEAANYQIMIKEKGTEKSQCQEILI